MLLINLSDSTLDEAKTKFEDLVGIMADADFDLVARKGY